MLAGPMSEPIREHSSIVTNDLEMIALYNKLHDYTGYTLEVYKKDGRTKDGWLLVEKKDYVGYDCERMEGEISYLKRRVYPDSKYRLEIFETWVLRTNIMTDKPFFERYDTPYYCSPSSESFWQD